MLLSICFPPILSFHFYVVYLFFVNIVLNLFVVFSSHPVGPIVMKMVSTLPITFNNHHAGVSPEAFAANSAISSTFTVLATNMDRVGNPFVSLIHANKMPIFASQYHPEVCTFIFHFG